LNNDGSVDGSFDRYLFVDGPVNAIVVQDDGRIIIGGNFETVDGWQRRSVARLEADGAVDFYLMPV